MRNFLKHYSQISSRKGAEDAELLFEILSLYLHDHCFKDNISCITKIYRTGV